jgi:LysR family transcriptional regulator for metE and metH
MNRLDRSHWRLLSALQRLGTLSAAAEAVAITQSAASQRLREAERRLGVALAERRGKAIVLNRAGQRIAATGAQLEQSLSAAEADAIWLGRNEGDRLRVLQQYHDNTQWFLQLCEAATRDAYGVEIELVRPRTDTAAAMLANGDADVALMPQAAEYPGVSSVPLFDDPLVGIVGPADELAGKAELSPADFVDRRYFAYEYIPQAGFELERFFRPADRYPDRIVSIESTETIVALVARSLGVSILSRYSLAGHEACDGVVERPLTGERLEVSWHLQVSDAAKPAPVADAIEQLVRSLRA